MWPGQHSKLAPIGGKRDIFALFHCLGHLSDGTKLQGFGTLWQLEKFVLCGKDYVCVNNSFFKRKEILLVQNAISLVLLCSFERIYT